MTEDWQSERSEVMYRLDAIDKKLDKIDTSIGGLSNAVSGIKGSATMLGTMAGAVITTVLHFLWPKNP